MKLALVGVAVVLLCHQGVLMSQCPPLGKCKLAYWRQTPWHTGGHLPEETSWGLSHNSDTWEGTERKRKFHRDGGKQREWEIMRDKERAESECEITLHGCCWLWLNNQVLVDKWYLSSRCWSSVRCSFSLLISSLLILVISLFLSMYLTTQRS